MLSASMLHSRFYNRFSQPFPQFLYKSIRASLFTVNVTVVKLYRFSRALSIRYCPMQKKTLPLLKSARYEKEISKSNSSKSLKKQTILYK